MECWRMMPCCWWWCLQPHSSSSYFLHSHLHFHLKIHLIPTPHNMHIIFYLKAIVLPFYFPCSLSCLHHWVGIRLLSVLDFHAYRTFYLLSSLMTTSFLIIPIILLQKPAKALYEGGQIFMIFFTWTWALFIVTWFVNFHLVLTFWCSGFKCHTFLIVVSPLYLLPPIPHDKHLVSSHHLELG